MKNKVHITQELFEHAQIEKEFETSFLISEMTERICGFSKRGPSGDYKPTFLETSNYFGEAKELSALAENVSYKLGIIGDDDKNNSYDFSFPSYAEFHETAAMLRSEMDKLPSDELPESILQDIEMGNSIYTLSYNASFHDGIHKQVTPSETISGYLLSKIMAALGLKAVVGGVMEVIAASGPWGVMMSAWKVGDMTTFKNALKLLIKFIFRGKFLKLLIQKIGESAAKRVFATMTGRLVPFLGWALIIGAFLYAVYEEL